MVEKSVCMSIWGTKPIKLSSIEFNSGSNMLQLDADMNLTPYVPPKPPICIEEKVKEFEDYGGISSKALRKAKLIFETINKEGKK